MTATELFKLALEARDRGQTMLMLDQPGTWGKRTYRHLAGRGTPRGRIVTDTAKPGRLLVCYDVEQILRFSAPLALEEIQSGKVILAVEDDKAPGPHASNV